LVIPAICPTMRTTKVWTVPCTSAGSENMARLNAPNVAFMMVWYLDGSWEMKTGATVPIE